MAIIIPESTIKRFQEGFIEVGAYKDLPVGNEVITTSGMTITPYFLNSEKLLRSPDISAVLKKFENSPKDLMEFASMQVEKEERFGEEMRLIAEILAPHLYKVEGKGKTPVIAGGMRRDVIFSGPVAEMMGITHISLFKNSEGEKLNYHDAIATLRGDNHLDGNLNKMFLESVKMDRRYQAVLLSDLLTVGSSQYRQDTITGEYVGWVPHLRALNIKVNDLLVVANRNEGGAGRLKDIGVNTYSLMPVTDGFLEQVSKGNALDRAKEYNKDPKFWTETYLLENGIKDIIKRSLEKGQEDRVIKFVNAHSDFLHLNFYKGKLLISSVMKYTFDNSPDTYQKLFKRD